MIIKSPPFRKFTLSQMSCQIITQTSHLKLMLIAFLYSLVWCVSIALFPLKVVIRYLHSAQVPLACQKEYIKPITFIVS